MNIVFEGGDNLTSIRELSSGQAFDVDGTVYIKTDEKPVEGVITCVNLETGGVYTFPEETRVKHVTAEVRIIGQEGK